MEQEQVIQEAFTQMAPDYEETVSQELRRFWGWDYQGFVDMLLKMTPIQEEDQILDVATGTAVIPIHILKNHGLPHNITGLDITYSMLTKAQQRLDSHHLQSKVDLTCATAMSMPFAAASFSLILCGLATHHMDVPVLIAEMKRILKPGGRIAIADVGGAAVWRLPVINQLIRTAAFLYLLPREGIARARVEAGALSNVKTPDEWHHILSDSGFIEIYIRKLQSKYAWIPDPLIIRATIN